jgi:dephospho-CoA kinase
MLKIGVTGNIGSGKSQVCLIFNILGIPVYNADIKAKELMINNKYLVSSIRTLIGDDAYFDDGSLNRTLISERVFKDQNLLNKLNALVHPAVGQDFLSWTNIQKGAYVIKEAALLYESLSFKELDAVIMVTAPEKLRIKRTMSRDGITEEQVLARMKNQMFESEKMAMADYIIGNDGDSFLVQQVLKVHRSILAR